VTVVHYFSLIFYKRLSAFKAILNFLNTSLWPIATMEDWQREIILENIDKLVDLTRCNISLLTKLLAAEVFSQSDIEDLVCQVQYLNPKFPYQNHQNIFILISERS